MLNWAMTSASETTNVLTEVAGRLRTLRTERGLTLVELSKSTGISKSTLSRLETRQRKPSLELLLPIAQAYASRSTTSSARLRSATRESGLSRRSGGRARLCHSPSIRMECTLGRC